MVHESVVHFIHALRRLEKLGDVEPMVKLFSEDAELSNVVHPAPFYGTAGAYRFWRNYGFLFQHVTTRFERVVETSETCVLEWTSEGQTPSGKPINYQGATILDFQDDKIVRLRAFFDSARFHEHETITRPRAA